MDRSIGPLTLVAMSKSLQSTVTSVTIRPGPWGSETRIRSCGGGVVLMDEPAEEIPPMNVARTDGDRVPRFGQRWGQAEGAMRSPAVVLLSVGPEGPIAMLPTEDQRPVEALGPDRGARPSSSANRMAITVSSLVGKP